MRRNGNSFINKRVIAVAFYPDRQSPVNGHGVIVLDRQVGITKMCWPIWDCELGWCAEHSAHLRFIRESPRQPLNYSTAIEIQSNLHPRVIKSR
jgi:hypothetical protein